MREITKMLVTGGLALSLLLTGCNQGGGGAQTDTEGTNQEAPSTATTPKDGTESGGADAPATDTATSGDTTEASLEDLNGWWKVTSLVLPDSDEQLESGKAAIDDYSKTYYRPCVCKINSSDRTFQMSAFLIELYGTISENTVDGWFPLDIESSTYGTYDETGCTARCRIETDGTLTIELGKDGEDGNSLPTLSYTCVKDEELTKTQSIDYPVYDYEYEACMDYRDANRKLPITWYPQPQVIAENDDCTLVLWGTGETEDSYVLATGIANWNQFSVMVGNYYLGPQLIANGNIPFDLNTGCQLLGEPEGSTETKAYDCFIYVDKSLVPDGLESVSGKLQITSVALEPYTTLDFNINL